MSDYPIGFGKPPKGRPFPPGQTGNPNGRPKNKKDLGEIVQQTLNASMTYRENGKTKAAPRREVAFKLLVEKAKKGDVAAAELILKKRRHAQRRGHKSALQFVVTDWLPDSPAQMSDQKAQDLASPAADPSVSSGEQDETKTPDNGKAED